MVKYQYEQSWDKLQQELPNVDIKSYVNESSKLCVQTWIANELAEANRLKRLEFQSYYCRDCRKSINPEKLEDKA